MASKNMKTDKRTIAYFKLLFILFSIVFITTSAVSYNLAARKLKEQLEQKCHALAATVAVIIAEKSDDYAAFLKTMDAESSYYRETKALMMKIKEANAKHVTYLYTVVQADEDTAMYVIGGESPDSPVYTAPGITCQMTDVWQSAFQLQEAVLGNDFINTPYGVRLSAYAPIFHSETGEFMGLAGADITQSQYSSIMNIFVIQTAIGLFAGLFMLAAAIFWLSGNVNFIINKERYEAELARKIVSTGREHYQKMDKLYDKLRVLHHDYKYHLNATRKMLGAGDTIGADQYLTDVSKKSSAYELEKYCSNPVINALLADYAERCVKRNIQFDANLNLPKLLSIPDYDLCIILGNLLENALEACEKLEHDRKIVLETKNIRNQLLFMLKNNFNGEINHRNGNLLSEKAKGGFGLRSVKEVISGYNGDITFEWDSGIFTAFVAVSLSRNENDDGVSFVPGYRE